MIATWVSNFHDVHCCGSFTHNLCPAISYYCVFSISNCYSITTNKFFFPVSPNLFGNWGSLSRCGGNNSCCCGIVPCNCYCLSSIHSCFGSLIFVHCDKYWISFSFFSNNFISNIFICNYVLCCCLYNCFRNINNNFVNGCCINLICVIPSKCMTI